MASKDDVKMLLRHYQNLYGDVELLVQYCSQRGSNLRDGFADVCDAISILEAQIREMDKVG